jgi:hypothetical protein
MSLECHIYSTDIPAYDGLRLLTVLVSENNVEKNFIYFMINCQCEISSTKFASVCGI